MSQVDFAIELDRLQRAVEAFEGMPPDVVLRMMAFLASRFHPSKWRGREMVPGDLKDTQHD